MGPARRTLRTTQPPPPGRYHGIVDHPKLLQLTLAQADAAFGLKAVDLLARPSLDQTGTARTLLIAARRPVVALLFVDAVRFGTFPSASAAPRNVCARLGARPDGTGLA